MLTLEQVKKHPQTKAFILQSQQYLDAIGYTDHGHRHLEIVAARSRQLARDLGLSLVEQEMAAIAGYCHDMANFLGRSQHHYLSAVLFYQIFGSQADDPREISVIMQAIAGHDKDELKIADKISAVLVLADKSDVHRSRVRERDFRNVMTDIHDRVNYAVTKNDFLINRKKKEVILKLRIDTRITKPMDYFQIFTERMSFCAKAAKYLNYKFILEINNFRLS